MKWVDYREKLGIGFNDEQKFQMLKNQFGVIIDGLDEDNYYKSINYKCYALMVGEPILSASASAGLKMSILSSKNLTELISKVVAICNSYSPYQSNLSRGKLFEFLCIPLERMQIPYEVIQDEDGYFIFPKGAKELDDALVSQPLEWLKEYPLSHKTFIKALKDYTSATEETASEAADSLRKALETFFQEFFGGSKSLENYKSGYGGFLKDHGIPTELANNFQTLLDSYTNYNNNYAKHHDKTSMNALEYLLYQTGNIIRLLITLKNGEKT